MPEAGLSFGTTPPTVLLYKFKSAQIPVLGQKKGLSMAHFKTETFKARSKVGAETLKVKISINSNGEFYCYMPEYLLTAAKGVFEYPDQLGDRFKVGSKTLSSLKEKIYRTLEIFTKPKITEEPIIRYNIESHVSFAEDEQGNIFPNAGFKNAKWRDIDDDDKYGSHHAASPSNGGYSLTIGAESMLKTVYKYGDSEKVEYEYYYKGESHLGHDNPAQLLNSWCSMKLHDNCKAKEIPYTDEAALFFHNLLLGMAQLSKRIQEHTFDQKNLLELISKGSGLLLPEKTE